MNKITLSKEIYQKSAIKHAIRAFGQIATIRLLEENEKYVSLIFEQCVADPQKTMDEFGNYVLAETIKSAGGMYD